MVSSDVLRAFRKWKGDEQVDVSALECGFLKPLQAGIGHEKGYHETEMP
jgi:hypothetical protein